MAKDLVKLGLNIVKRSGVSIVGSVDQDGFPNIKAMLAPREHDGLREFFFTTNTSSMRVKQYRENGKASVYFFDRRFFKGLLLTGTMEVLEDQATKERIWRTGDTMYYHQGVTDPDYCVLRFVAKTGRIYESFASYSFEVR